MTETQNLIFNKNQEPSRMEGMSKALGFDIPVEQTALPSEGKLYSSDHPFYEAETVEVRSMTAREEDLLTSSALHKSGQVITKLIESCLINKSVDVNTLLNGDRDAILIALRVIGYGSDYKVRLTCPECDEQFAHTFELKNLAIKKLGAEPVEPNTNRFSYRLPLSDLPVEFKLLTCGEEKEISVTEERRKKLATQAESKVTTRLFYSIQSINGQTDRAKLANIVSSLRAGDSRALRNYIAKISPGVDMSQEATCPHCGESSEVQVPLSANFFWPDYD